MCRKPCMFRSQCSRTSQQVASQGVRNLFNWGHSFGTQQVNTEALMSASLHGTHVEHHFRNTARITMTTIERPDNDDEETRRAKARRWQSNIRKTWKQSAGDNRARTDALGEKHGEICNLQWESPDVRSNRAPEKSC